MYLDLSRFANVKQFTSTVFVESRAEMESNKHTRTLVAGY